MLNPILILDLLSPSTKKWQSPITPYVQLKKSLHSTGRAGCLPQPPEPAGAQLHSCRL